MQLDTIRSIAHSLIPNSIYSLLICGIALDALLFTCASIGPCIRLCSTIIFVISKAEGWARMHFNSTNLLDGFYITVCSEKCCTIDSVCMLRHATINYLDGSYQSETAGILLSLKTPKQKCMLYFDPVCQAQNPKLPILFISLCCRITFAANLDAKGIPLLH